MRLIDADALTSDLTRFYEGEVPARKLIAEQPTVDAVPVVRCRECKWGRTVREGSEYVWCGKPYAAPWSSHIANWYCADGRRKEDEKDGPVD